MARTPPSYREFMRARRPQLYSDTVQIEVSETDRQQFEFQLTTLTTRKEETPFENFARALAQKELCPNLLPQTGPTGGGDSKVDTETYPVASAIATLWYEGNPNVAGSERWAFAVSAKAKWKPKLDSDVEKIVGTGRPYSLIYFITNQSVPDRERAATQEALKTKYGVEVRIMDRTWIVDSVVRNKRWDIVAQTLQFELPTKQITRYGPLDTERLQELEVLDSNIEAVADGSLTLELVEEALQSALLARGLERPRTEVDGRFSRAERLARSIHSTRQLLRVRYQQAWTAIWWYDDAAEAARIYDVLAPDALHSEWIWDLELLVNLWLALQNALPPDEPRTTALRAALERHKADGTRETASLWARTQLLFMDLVGVFRTQADPSPTLQAMREALGEVNRLVEFPVHTLVQFARELAEVLGDSPALDELMDAVIEVERTRNGNRAAGELRLQRGMKKLGTGKPYEAIDDLSKAQFMLAQEETRKEFIAATAGAGLAFEAAGLLYAARGILVGALDRSLYGHFKHGTADKRALPLAKKLVWVELQLGRVPYALAWLKMIPAIHSALSVTQEQAQEFAEELAAIDRVLGILLLRTPHDKWVHLAKLPDALEKLGLLLSRSAALFMLGHEDVLRTEYETADSDLQQFHSDWVNSPAAEDLPSAPIWHIGKTTYETMVLGCHISITIRGPATSTLLAESILGFLEAFYSTAIQMPSLMSPLPELRIEVRQTDGAKAPFTIRTSEDDCGETTLIVTHPVLSPTELVGDGFQDAIMLLFAHVTAQMQLGGRMDAVTELFAKHRAQDRAFQIALAVIPVTNLLGDEPRYRAADWVDEAGLREYPLKRPTAWRPTPALPTPTTPPSEEKVRMAFGKPPEELFGADAIKHSDVRVMSPINMPLWDRARWRGVGVSMLGEPGAPPLMALAFTDIAAGRKIFRGWHKKVGQRDVQGWIGIIIVRGINRERPLDYRVAIGIGEHFIRRQMPATQRFLMVHRMHDMHPTTPQSLQTLLDGYKRAGSVLLIPGEFEAAQKGLPMNREDIQMAIQVSHVEVVDAWEVGVESHALTAMQGIVDPVVPAGITAPPFAEVVRRFREIGQAKGGEI